MSAGKARLVAEWKHPSTNGWRIGELARLNRKRLGESFSNFQVKVYVSVRIPSGKGRKEHHLLILLIPPAALAGASADGLRRRASVKTFDKLSKGSNCNEG